MSKLICLGLSCVLVLGLLAGCGFKGPGGVVRDIIENEVTEDTPDVSTVPEEEKGDKEDKKEFKETKDKLINSADLKNKNLYSFLNSFVSYLSQDIVDDNLLSYFHIPENSYISVSDIEWLLPRIKLDNFVGCDITNTDIEKAVDVLEDGTLYEISLKTEEKMVVPLTVVLNNDNEFKVSLKDNIISDYMINFPTFGEVKIDGVVIPESYLAVKDALRTTYKFGGIIAREHTYTYNNDMYGELSVSLVPVVSKDIQSGDYLLDSIEGKDYLPIVKDLWNNIVSTSVANNGDISSIRKFFVSDFDEAKLSTYATDLYKYLDFKEDTVPVMSDIAWVSSGDSFVLSDNAVSVCIKFKINYIDYYLGSKDLRDATRVNMVKVNDTWVLHSANDGFLDYEFNPYRDNWDKY